MERVFFLFLVIYHLKYFLKIHELSSMLLTFTARQHAKR
jgi:hypothetical protein